MLAQPHLLVVDADALAEVARHAVLSQVSIHAVDLEAVSRLLHHTSLVLERIIDARDYVRLDRVHNDDYAKDPNASFARVDGREAIACGASPVEARDPEAKRHMWRTRPMVPRLGIGMQVIQRMYPRIRQARVLF